MPAIAATKSNLSVPRQRLLEVMQSLNFGRLENLNILRGEPVFSPPPRIVKEIKLGGQNDPRPEIDRRDFALKAELVEFFEHLAKIGTATIESIEVKHGIPFRIIVERPDTRA